MTPSIDRRTLLAAVATSSVAALAGCSSSCPDSGAPEPDVLVSARDTPAGQFSTAPDGAWPAPRYDAGNTGYVPDVTPPETPLSVQWRSALPTREVEATGDQASAPAVADGRVLVATADGVVALALRDGTEAWLATDATPNTTAPTHSYDDEIVPPVVGPDGTVYVGATDGLVALDPSDGSERWRYEEAGAVRTPAVADGTVYVPAGEELVAVDAADGTEQWRTPVGVTGGLPAVGADVVAVASGDAVAVDPATGERRWDRQGGTDFYPVVADGTVYLGGYQGLRALDPASGDQRWLFERGGGRSLSAPVVTPDSLYVTERPGEAGDATFALDRTDGAPSPRWCSDVGEGAVTAATDGTALGLLASGSVPDEPGPPVRLVAYGERFGSAAWGYRSRDRLLPPALLDGAAIVVDRRGAVVALGGE